MHPPQTNFTRKATVCLHAFIPICADSETVGMVIIMKIRKCKNGSFFVKREPEHDTPLNDADFGNGLNLIFDLVNSAELDFVIAGDEGCADNFHMYY